MNEIERLVAAAAAAGPGGRLDDRIADLLVRSPPRLPSRRLFASAVAGAAPATPADAPKTAIVSRQTLLTRAVSADGTLVVTLVVGDDGARTLVAWRFSAS